MCVGFWTIAQMKNLACSALFVMPGFAAKILANGAEEYWLRQKENWNMDIEESQITKK
jgi:hypothetical protein